MVIFFKIIISLADIKKNIIVILKDFPLKDKAKN